MRKMTTKKPLDRIDRQILMALQNDARLSNKELAARVGLAPSSCLERVRRLRKRRMLGSAHALAEPTGLGVGVQALVAVDVYHQSRSAIEAFDRSLRALPEVVALFNVSGRHDFLVHLACRDTAHLRELMFEAFTGVAAVRYHETSLIFDRYRAPGWPDLVEGTTSQGVP
jgi:DNA-binding Lrp family transcriptional regulator